ncbi:RNA polymerase sigma factor [Tissierella carlieri]|jgi:RNA polymerase sigma-70 factor (ECF subfamily)|uniref:RNA polymerase sigma factor n=1 Tax=Tissierella carlieri TaxID=689904 RepID=UPI0028064671|nr:sigma-70 family RNA polymerase sigma factor [uncultured Tissierella sp.]MDU5083423.1 sigma-70 family RNA polymerase sigma factor [Bacillota bacterium]
MANNLENQLEDYIIKNKELFYRLAYSYVKNIDDALDVVQESIYKAFSSIDSLKDFGYIKTWFYRIIVNVSLDLLRKRKREIITDEEFILSNDVGAVDHYADIDLKKALETLPENYRSIIVLRFFEDLKLEEIAEILDQNINTVKTRLYKALEILRLSMDDEDKEAKNG